MASDMILAEGFDPIEDSLISDFLSTWETVEAIDGPASDLRTAVGDYRGKVEGAESTWGGLESAYSGPGAWQLYGAMGWVLADANVVYDTVEGAANGLDAFAEELEGLWSRRSELMERVGDYNLVGAYYEDPADAREQILIDMILLQSDYEAAAEACAEAINDSISPEHNATDAGTADYIEAAASQASSTQVPDVSPDLGTPMLAGAQAGLTWTAGSLLRGSTLNNVTTTQQSTTVTPGQGQNIFMVDPQGDAQRAYAVEMNQQVTQTQTTQTRLNLQVGLPLQQTTPLGPNPAVPGSESVQSTTYDPTSIAPEINPETMPEQHTHTTALDPQNSVNPNSGMLPRSGTVLDVAVVGVDATSTYNGAVDQQIAEVQAENPGMSEEQAAQHIDQSAAVGQTVGEVSCDQGGSAAAGSLVAAGAATFWNPGGWALLGLGAGTAVVTGVVVNVDWTGNGSVRERCGEVGADLSSGSDPAAERENLTNLGYR